MKKAQRDGEFDDMDHYFKICKRMLQDKLLVTFYQSINLAEPKEYVANRIKLLNFEFKELIKCMQDGEVEPPPIPPLEPLR
jgi:hypothetical protein